MLGHTITLVVSLLAQPAPSASSSLTGDKPIKARPFALRASGVGAGALTLTRVDLTTGVESAPLLAGIRLLPIDIAGRSPVYDLAAATGQLVDVGGGAVALQLPGPRAIRVFQYQRQNPTRFGFFAVRGDAQVDVLLEIPGIGPSGSVSPFDRHLGVSRDGATIAIAAADPSGGIDGVGELWLARCDGQPLANGSSVVELTGPGIQEAAGPSLAFHQQDLYAVVDERLVRAPADGSGPFQLVPLPQSGGVAPAMVEDGIVRSADGSTLALLAGGLDETSFDIYLIDATGTARNLTNAPAPYQEPGFFPDEIDGPYLALSEDASSIAYQIDFPLGNELFVRSTAPGATPFQITSDVDFDPSIDQLSGILTGGSFTRFVAAAGNQGADLYRVELPTVGLPKLENLTKTSGVALPWFPNAATMNVKSQHPLRGSRLMVDDQTATGQGFGLWHVATTDVVTNAWSNLIAAPIVVKPALAVNHAVAIAKTASQHFLLRVGASAPPSPIVYLPPGIEIRAAAMRDGGAVTALLAAVPGFEGVVLLATHGPGFALVNGGPFQQLRDPLFARDGRLLFAGSGGGQAITYAVTPTTLTALAVGAPAPLAFWLR
jgi:hypothetical protein